MQNGHFQFHNYIAAAFNTAAHWTKKGGKSGYIAGFIHIEGDSLLCGGIILVTHNRS